jgi:iron complex transport system substrate-binding protein
MKNHFRTARFLAALLFLFHITVFADEIRVVSLAPSLTELVFHLGCGRMLVGRSTVCDHPAEAVKLPVAGGFADPDLERVLKLKPTVVITNDLMKPAKGKALERAGVRLVRMQCRNMDEYIRWTETLGRLLNCPEAASAETARVRKKMEKLLLEAEKVSPKKKICWVIWDAPLMIAGGGSLPETVIRYAGGVNLAEGLQPEYIKASKDWLIRNQPDVLVWTCTRPLNRQDRFWRALKAVRNGAVIEAPDSALLLRPGPRLPEGIEWLKRELEKIR